MAENFDNGSETGTGNRTDSGSTSATMDESDCSVFTFVVYVVVFGTIVLFGLVGNGLSWFVLAWDRRDRGRVASFLLRTMAVADNLFLVAAGLAQISSALVFYLDSTGYASTADITVENPTGKDPTNHVTKSYRDWLEPSPLPTNHVMALSDPETSPADYTNGTRGRSLYDDVSAYVTTYVTVCVFPFVHV